MSSFVILNKSLNGGLSKYLNPVLTHITRGYLTAHFLSLLCSKETVFW